MAQQPQSTATTTKKESVCSHKIDAIPALIRDPLSRQYLPSAPQPLGQGGFASVFRAKIIDRRLPAEAAECALKVVRSHTLTHTSKQLRSRFRYELAIHNKLRHPNIVQFFRAFKFADLTYVSLELCENGSLTDVMKKRKYLTMPEIRRYMIQLCGAVDYLHAREIVHRDVKAGNVFLDANMDVKLGDFGLAAVLEPSADDAGLFNRRTTFCGTPNYLAPELLSRHKGHAAGVDIWALGVLLFYLAVGAAPFHSKSKEEIYKRVMAQKYTWPVTPEGFEDNEIPQEMKELVMRILVEEEQRPSCREIVEDPFFSEGYIPERIDPLARTRRPRWARGMHAAAKLQAEGQSDNETYNRLVSSSFVKEGMNKRGRITSVLVEAEREVTEGVVLEIPLQDNFVYQRWTGGARAKRKRAVEREPTIHEDSSEARSTSRPRTAEELSVPKARAEPAKTSAEARPATVRAKTEPTTVKARAAAINATASAPPRRPVEGELTMPKRRTVREKTDRSLRVLVETTGNAAKRSVRVASREKKKLPWDVEA
ncbi:MAG: hypothetical protein Q9159_000092 [Coniocarpon cinnabarinum]